MASGDVLIAQITDTHLEGAAEDGADSHWARLDRVLDHLCAMTRLPDMLLVTGDLVDTGGEDANRLLKARLGRCPFPAYVTLGNHDDRAVASAVFGRGDGEFLQYTVDAADLRVIVLDTHEDGRHGGAFCETRAAWLGETLREEPDRPVLIALHHAPIDTGLDWMTTSPSEPWLARLDAALAESAHVIAIVAGHVHRAMASLRGGIPVHVCPPIGGQLALDLAELSPAFPDGRPLVVSGLPGYALHLWRDGVLTTHFDFVEERRTYFSFDAAAQPFMRSLFAERSG